MSEFKIPKQAIEEAADITEPMMSSPSSDESFKVSERAARELDQSAGQISAADELLAGSPPSEPESEPQPSEEELTVAEWTRQRNNILLQRNFSFISGETRETYEALKPRHQKKVKELAAKLIEHYTDRGVTEKTTGLLMDNSMLRFFRTHPGVGGAWGDAYEEFYIVCMGSPLEDQQQQRGKKESETSALRYHGRKVPIANFMDMAVGRGYGGRSNAIPLLNDDEWLPTILAVTRRQK